LQKDDVNILDLGCGTGLVGKYLHEKGYKGVDGIDASQGMLAESKQKEVYSKLHQVFLGKPDTFPQEFHKQYHFITGSGILADNHLDCSVFEEMLLALKDEGVCIFTTRIEYLTKYGYGPYMEKLSTEGRWKLVKEANHTKYNKLENQIGRFTPTEMKVFAYQKLSQQK
jgi:2-polyprenyl-3-methyl-5-hydroxy-6-metoxy-1,4-benzoquinol methylase